MIKLSSAQLKALRLAANFGGCSELYFRKATWRKLEKLGFVYTDRSHVEFYLPVKRPTDAGLNYLRTEV